MAESPGEWIRWSITVGVTVAGTVGAFVAMLIRTERRMTRQETVVESERELARVRVKNQQGFIEDVRNEMRMIREELRDDIGKLDTKLDQMLLALAQKGEIGA